MSSRHPHTSVPELDDIASQTDPREVEAVPPPKLKRECRKISFAQTSMTFASRKQSNCTSYQEQLEEFFHEESLYNEEKKEEEEGSTTRDTGEKIPELVEPVEDFISSPSQIIKRQRRENEQQQRELE